MTTPSFPIMTCAEFQAMLPDWLEDGALSPAAHDAAAAHLADCAECAALESDLRTIVRQARDLPLLSPGRELWGGIEARIEAPVVALSTRVANGEGTGTAIATPVTAHGAADAPPLAPAAGSRGVVTWRRFAVAASLLVTVTAGVTWTLATRSSIGAGVRGASGGRDASISGQPPLDTGLLPATYVSASVTFDREIDALRALVDARRSELDPLTVGIVEKNLKVIDHAISESKAALANDPASAFLMDRLTRAYDSKLQLMRELATRSPRS
jgi:hypothetical protein